MKYDSLGGQKMFMRYPEAQGLFVFFPMEGKPTSIYKKINQQKF